jgi:hypothetical protein
LFPLPHRFVVGPRRDLWCGDLRWWCGDLRRWIGVVDLRRLLFFHGDQGFARSCISRSFRLDVSIFVVVGLRRLRRWCHLRGHLAMATAAAGAATAGAQDTAEENTP